MAHKRRRTSGGQGSKVKERNSAGTREDAYEVEKIVGKKTYDGKVYYKVKWIGFDDKTWEPAENCDCQALIKAYEDARSEDEAEDEWEVEQILDKRVRNEKVEYLVRWKGWPGDPSWVLSESCQCFNLIAAFENPKLKKLWNFTGSNQNLWLRRAQMLKYMKIYIESNNCRANLLKFEPDLPLKEKQLELREGINIGPLCYENHWYLIIILVNHICVTRRILIGDSLNILIGTRTKSHPVVKRLSTTYTHFPIKPIRLTQMDRSDVCAFYILAAFERALFLFGSKAKFVTENIFFDSTRAELIRSEIKPETDGEISVALPIPEAFDHGPMCEFCEELFDSRQLVDQHILIKHMCSKVPNSISSSVSPYEDTDQE